MKKREMLESIIDSPAWCGEKDINYLMRSMTLEEVKDAYNEIEEAEREYFDYIY